MYQSIQKISFCILVMLGLFLPTHSVQAEESTFQPVVIASFSGYDNFWDSIEKIADLIGYKDSVVATRSIAADVQGLDKSAPIGFLLMTDGDSLLPFGFLPIKSLDELEFIGSEDLKADIEKTEDGTFLEINSIKLELLEKEGWLFVFEPGKADEIPAGNPVDLLENLNQDYLLAVKMYGQNIPRELIDNLLAPVRQEMAKADSEQANIFDFQMNYFFDVFGEFQSIITGLNINAESGDLELNFSIVPVQGSIMSSSFKEMSKGRKTQWAHFFDPSQSVFTGISSGILDERHHNYLKEYYGMTFETVFSKLDEIQEAEMDEESEAKVKQILEKVQEFTNSCLENKTIDFAFSLTNEPQILVGATIKNGQALLDILKIGISILENTNADFAKKYIKLASGMFKGYTVSSFSFPFADIEEYDENANVPESFIDKQAAVIIAIKDDALIFVAGLDKKSVSDKFKSLAKHKRTETEIPKRYIVSSFENLGKVLNNLITEQTPEVAAILNTMSEAGPDAICYAELVTISESEFVVKEVINGQNFVMIGDIIRGIFETTNDDESEDFEDEEILFDDEETNDEETEDVEIEEESAE
ncbi:MAG: hypothetical protein Q4C95_03625 [Planctomycetia bacterium]|nr:hypothetical protein [Planctomycetia bacterium]